MAVMLPQYEKGSFAIGELAGECLVVPEKHKDGVPWDDDPELEKGWFCRLFSEGAGVGTTWTGAFDSKQDAMDFIEDTFVVDAETGDDLQEDEEEAAA